MLLEVPAFDKAFLRVVEDVEEGRRDDANDRLGQNPVVSVGN